MIKRGFHAAALAAMISGRVQSFVHGNLRFSRIPHRGLGHPHAFTDISTSSARATEDQPEKWGRANADDITFDPQLIANKPDVVVSHLRARRMAGESINAVTTISGLMKTRRELLSIKEKALNKRKTLSAQIGQLMKQGDSEVVEDRKREVEIANSDADAAEKEQHKVDDNIRTLFQQLPNLLDSRVPDGDGEEQNEIISSWGEEFLKKGEEYFWHDELALMIGGWDSEGAARIAGSRFSVLKGPLARLERAIAQWMLDFHTTHRGYTEVSVPLLVTRSSLEGTGQLPKFEDDLFKTNHQVANEDSFLIPTGEVPVTNLLRGQLLGVGELPMSFVSLTPCFRAEAGSAGRDTRGLLRQHQFLKVELVKITTPEQSREEHEALTQDAEAILKALKLPFRRVSLCSGDIGFGARLCYDLEVWMPGQGKYREISSCSNCQDFQAQRMALRYRQPVGAVEGAKSKKTRNVFCHTINGSGVAVGRALAAILENYYNSADGSVEIPEVLRPYMGGMDCLGPL